MAMKVKMQEIAADGNVPRVGPEDVRMIESKDVDRTDPHLRITEETLKQAMAIVKPFHKEAEKLQTLKEQLDETRGGLSNHMWELAKLATTRTDDAPQYRLAYYDYLCDAVEFECRKAYAHKAKTDVEAVKIRDAMGASWQTYRSQIRKAIKASYNPTKFTNGTAFRDTVKVRGTKNRAPTAPVVGGEVVVEQLLAEDLAKTVEPIVAQALLQLRKEVLDSYTNDAKAVAQVLTTAITKIAKITQDHTDRNTKGAHVETAATASM